MKNQTFLTLQSILVAFGLFYSSKQVLVAEELALEVHIADNWAPHSLVGHQSVFIGTVDGINLKIHEKSYYLDATTVITNNLNSDVPVQWSSKSYEFKAINGNTVLVTTFENDGGQIESTINYRQSIYDEDGKHTDSGDVSFLYKHPDIGVFNGVGTWECQHLNIEEVPVEELPENYVPTVAVHAGEVLIEDNDHNLHIDHDMVNANQGWTTLTEIPDGFSAPPADSQVTQALVTFYNPSTHEIWTAPTGGYVPAPGWIEGDPTVDLNDFGYAPSSLSGYIVSYHEPDETITSSYSVEDKVYGDDGFTYFSYEKISENIGRVTYTFENESNPQPEVKTLTFLSENSGTFTMLEYTDSTMSTEDGSVSGEFDISISDSQYGSSEGGYAGAPDDDHGSKDAGYAGEPDDHEHEEYVDLELPEEYKFEDGSEIGYWEEERYSETGELEIVAHLENGIQVIFDKDGKKIDEVDPYSFFQQEEFDAGLSFNPLASKWMDDNNNSGKFSFEGETKGSSPVLVDISKVDEREPEYGSILYRISLLNGDSQLDLNGTDLALGTSLSLTFNYDSNEPMYLIVSGAEVSGYRNTYPSWDGTPGSFTIKAKTVAPVASASNPDGSIGSTFGITVQMGGERHYGGTIFETNVIASDVGPAEFASPWDRVFSFAIDGVEGTATSVRALMPRRHLNDHFGIYEASEVKAAIADTIGVLSFVAGSRSYSADSGETEVGASFKRIPHKGNEPSYEDSYSYYGPMPMVDTDVYRLDNDEFGLDEEAEAFLGDFDQDISYDSGDIVMHEGKTYVALEGVPAGTPMDSLEMWKLVEEEELYSDDFSLDEFKNPAEGSEEPHDHDHGYAGQPGDGLGSADDGFGGQPQPDDAFPSSSDGYAGQPGDGLGSADDGFGGQPQPDDGIASVDDGYASQPDDSQYFSDTGSNQVSEQVANDSATPVTEQVDTGADSIRRSGEEALQPSEGNPEKKTVASKFDFDGDQLADSLLEISFIADVFPGEVQIGDPFDDPFASIDPRTLGSISGTVKGSGAALDEFGIFIFSAPDGIDNGHWEPAPVYEFNHDGNGTYSAKVMAGTYYIEAWGFDPMTGKSYQADVYGNESDDDLPTSLTFVDESSIFTAIDFDLEEEYVMQHVFANVSSSLAVPASGEGPNEIYGAFLDLTPVDVANGKARLTDYPVQSLHIDFDGSIRGEAPIGDFLVELVSHGKPMDLASEVIWNIAGGDNSFEALQVIVKQAYRISGRAADQDGDGVWADILFVDPQDEDEITYPSWEPMPMGPEQGEFLEGSYSVKVPEGSYKILAREHSGLFEDAYYNGMNFSDAEVFAISADLSDVNFTMVAAPFSSISIRLEDNASNPITGAWFNLFDGDDEFGPMFFPEVEESGDGNYTLNIPEGSYKVEVSAPDYKSFFMVRDDFGDVAWEEAYWEIASSIETKDGETTSLGTATLEQHEFEDWQRFELEWFDATDTDFVGNTIKGTVKTSQGAAVPNARIIARTEDHLIRIDHVETRRDGSFEVDNLPDGKWVVFAEPPFESDEFQGFRESDPNREPVLLDGGHTQDGVDLVLQGANVSGRVVFPKKNKTTGNTKIQSLADAHIWVYQDNDADGEPDFNDWFYEADSMFNEAFSHTDDKGFFSLNLPEGGTYSMRIDLPGRMASLEQKPVTFQLKNPDQEVKIGNAIKLEWSTNKKVDKFDIRRKVKSSDESYKTVFAFESNRLSSARTSYVDNTIIPGVSYEYRVVSIDSNDIEENLSGDNVKTSSPILYLSPPSKSVSGFVGDDKNQSVSGAMIEAWRTEGEGWASAYSETNGSFELTLGPGEWEISVFRPYDENVPWVYDAPPARVEFKSDSSVENKPLEPFLVSSMAGGKVIGSVELPTGKTAAELSQYVYIDVYDPMGRGDWSNPDSDGNFEIPLQPGEYELSVWVDPLLTGYGSPTGQIVRVGKTSVNVGELQLATFDSNITGTLTTDSGSYLPNVEVWAWSEEGGWSSAFTNAKGEYTLNVAPGRWEVGYEIPVADDGSEPPYLPEPPKRVRIKQSGESKVLNFKARDASASVSGVVLVDVNGSQVPVTDLDAWVYAKEYLDNPSDDEFMDIIAEVPLSQFGTFSFPSFPGSYNVGIWLPPGSEYELPDEKLFQINESGQLFDDNGTLLEEATFVLSSVSSSLSGEFMDNNTSLSGLIGEVYAMRTDGDGWRHASIESDGSYSMTLPEGNWVIDYYIEYDEQARNYPSYPQQPISLEIINGANDWDFDFSSVDKISSTISGTVVDENGNELNGSSVYVWAYREGSDTLSEYWNEVETDDDGNFSISILPGGRYEVGVFLTEELRQLDYLDSPVQEFHLKSDSNQSSVSFELVKPSAENFISGTVTDDKNNILTEALVYAWTYDGLEAETLTDENGSFSINVPMGSIWKVGAEYSEFNASDVEIFYFSKRDLDVDLRDSASVENIDIVLELPDFVVPEGTSVTFDPSADFVTRLPDGTELTIPGGASNVSEDIESVRLVITPNAKLSKDASVKTADYGYSIELFDANGKKVEGNFKKDVIITIPVDITAVEDNGLDLDNIEGKYFSSTKNAWESAKTSTWDQASSKLTMTTDHFSEYVVGSTPNVSDLSKESLSLTVDNWYHSSWFGSFYDAGDGWIFHEKLDWLYTQGDLAGNFWFYHPTYGWIWTGSNLYDQSEVDKAFFYDYDQAIWYYYQNDGSFYAYPSEP